MKTTVENMISQTPDRLLTEKEERELTKREEEGDREARKKLIIHNHRLVISIAKDYKDNGVPFEDLIMVGFEGLVKGIKRFDPQLENKLSTYVTYWIHQAIMKELNKNSRTIRVPSYVRSLKRKVDQLEENLEEELSPSDISEEFGVGKKVARSVKQLGPTTSLDSPVSESGNETLKKMIKNRKAKNPSKSVSQKDRSEKLLSALEKRLSDRERRIIKLYYGVEDNKSRTLDEVAKVFDLCKERIRQLRDRALEKLEADRKLAGLTSN